MQELILQYIFRPATKTELKMNSSKFIFQVFWAHSQKGWDSEEICCRTAVSLEHLSVTVSVFCVDSELETPYLAVIFQYLHLYTYYDNKCGIPWRRLMRCFMLRCTDMGIPLSCDYAASSFLGIFSPYTNKSYWKATK